jgi:hypothetical protein
MSAPVAPIQGATIVDVSASDYTALSADAQAGIQFFDVESGQWVVFNGLKSPLVDNSASFILVFGENHQDLYRVAVMDGVDGEIAFASYPFTNTIANTGGLRVDF